MRVRGLKSLVLTTVGVPVGVAPHAGAWIEISRTLLATNCHSVAPRAGAWIEISIGLGDADTFNNYFSTVLLSRFHDMCGFKAVEYYRIVCLNRVGICFSGVAVQTARYIEGIDACI